MKLVKPQNRLLLAWRAMLILISAPPAFLCSFLLRIPGVAWLLAIGIWASLFLFFYLFYLPARWRGLSLSIGDTFICMNRGVFSKAVSVVPLSAIRFTRVLQGPLARLSGICVLHVAAAGGGIFMPGLNRKDAHSLASALVADLRDPDWGLPS
ncbi:MAG: PH domain-containing protein [Oscillospiraceae bacterium]|nr:PH domain-containing protein [Oscillospiraceae bacterium]